MSPRIVAEVLGISEWDGKGRANQYPFGLLLVTHTGGTYYISVPTIEERDEWIIHVKQALECTFANSEIQPFKPTKILQNRPPMSTKYICAMTKMKLSKSSAIHCRSCGRCFSSSEFVSETTSLLQIGVEFAEKVCSDCKLAQICVLWLKSMNYTHAMALHELTPCVLKEVHRFKASFKLRRR